jgi:hypothetical protein
MPNLLFVCPTTANIYKLFLDGFKDFTPEVKVSFMSNTFPRYHYKNKAERIGNFLSKVFLNRNTKEV